METVMENNNGYVPSPADTSGVDMSALGWLVDRIAERAHNEWARSRRAENPGKSAEEIRMTYPDYMLWKDLPQERKASSLGSAEQAVRLMEQRFGVERVMGGSVPRAAVVEALAENAHEVWARQRMDAGWTYGEVRDNAAKVHPMLRPYGEIPDSEKEYDRAYGRLAFDSVQGMEHELYAAKVAALDDVTLRGLIDGASAEDGVLDLRGLDLRGRDLHGLDLSRADLSRADLRGTDLHGADLTGTDLHLARFDGRSDLSEAKLAGAYMQAADFGGADLHGADMRHASLFDANLSGADLRGADLRGADLKVAEMSRADLRGANLSGADLFGASLLNADLRDADLRGVQFVGLAVSSRTRLEGAAMDGDLKDYVRRFLTAKRYKDMTKVASLPLSRGKEGPKL